MSRPRISTREKKVLTFIGSDVKSKAEIVAECGRWYFGNQAKHVGDVLTRLVRSGWLDQPVTNHYCAAKVAVPNDQSQSQTGLFGDDEKETK